MPLHPPGAIGMERHHRKTPVFPNLDNTAPSPQRFWTLNEATTEWLSNCVSSSSVAPNMVLTQRSAEETYNLLNQVAQQQQQPPQPPPYNETMAFDGAPQSDQAVSLYIDNN